MGRAEQAIVSLPQSTQTTKYLNCRLPHGPVLEHLYYCDQTNNLEDDVLFWLLGSEGFIPSCQGGLGRKDSHGGRSMWQRLLTACQDKNQQTLMCFGLVGYMISRTSQNSVTSRERVGHLKQEPKEDISNSNQMIAQDTPSLFHLLR